PSGSSWTITYFRYFPYTGTEGCDPETALTYSGGRLWGTTKGGGSSGQGTVFSMDTSGDGFQSESFTGNNGSQPLSAFSSWGYGTTYSGGENSKGNLYKLDPVMGLISKYSFKVDGKEGYAPMGNLLTLYVGGLRTIYGTTSAGGAGGGGTIYRLTEAQPNSDRWRVTVLHSFSSSGNGTGPAPKAGLTADAAGNLYGTTERGGLNGTSIWGGERRSDCGTVFKLSPGKDGKWTHTVLHSFDSYNEEGCHPTAGVALDGAGHLYGTTTAGGWYSVGTVYEIIP
ncbi:MAG: choice-of-anchor tandem repeat GloVer-containing protein, partial [Candidatus Dormibacteraceae bacterium]